MLKIPREYISVGKTFSASPHMLWDLVTDYEQECFWNWKVASIRATGHYLQFANEGGAILWFEIPVIVFPYIAICRMALTRIAACVAESR